MLTVHVEHGTHHLQLPFGIHQRKKLMHITVSIPKGEYGIPVALCRKNPVAFHCRILPVDVLQKVGMYQRMIKRRIENNLLLVRPAFHYDTRQIVVPTFTAFRQYLVEVLAGLLFVQIETGILDTDERNTHLHLYLLALPGIECQKSADIIARQLLAITGIQFILTVVRIPFGLHACHGALFFPITGFEGSFVNTHHEVNRKYRLRIVAESTEQLHPLKFTLAGLPQESSGFIGQSLSQVQQNMTPAFWKSEARHTGARRGSHFGLYIITGKEISVIPRRGLFVFITAAILLVVYGKLARSGHQQQRTKFGTSHTTEIDMRIPGKEAVVILIGSGPPTGILIVFVVRRPHHVERNNRHHPVGADSSRIGCAEVSRTDKGIHIVYRGRTFLRSRRHSQQNKGKYAGKECSFHGSQKFMYIR